jgi:ATP-dependent DNA helicase RecQ
LLAYFGERNGRDCGHCDVCVSMKKVAISDDEYGDIENAIKALLEAGPAEPGQIVMDLGFDEEKIWKVVRRLEDTGTVYINKEGYLQLSQTEL